MEVEGVRGGARGRGGGWQVGMGTNAGGGRVGVGTEAGGGRVGVGTGQAPAVSTRAWRWKPYLQACAMLGPWGYGVWCAGRQQRWDRWL
jgi:hypothetical protein